MSLWEQYRPARPHQWDGSVADVRAARFDGMTAYAEPKLVAQAGAMAGLMVVLLLFILPLSPIRLNNIVQAGLFSAVYGMLLGGWRRKGILEGKTKRLFNRDFLPHSLFTYWFIPLVPVVYFSLLPELSSEVSASIDTFTGSMIMLMLFFWIGAFYDYLWEAFHNFCLAWLHRNNKDKMHEYTLRMWLPREEKERRFRLDELHFQDGKVYVRGVFENAAQLHDKLLLLDFVKEAKVEQVREDAG